MNARIVLVKMAVYVLIPLPEASRVNVQKDTKENDVKRVCFSRTNVLSSFEAWKWTITSDNKFSKYDDQSQLPLYVHLQC